MSWLADSIPVTPLALGLEITAVLCLGILRRNIDKRRRFLLKLDAFSTITALVQFFAFFAIIRYLQTGLVSDVVYLHHIPSRLLPYDFEHTLLCGIVLRKRPNEEPTYDIPSSFFTSDYYDTYSASPVSYQPIQYFCIGNHLDHLSIVQYLTRLRRTLYLPEVQDLDAFGPRFGLQHSTSVIIVTPSTKDHIRRVVAALARFDQLIATAQRKSRDREDYTTEIDNIRHVSEYVDEYYWILEILTPFVVNQQSDHPERFIVTVLQSDFWAVINHSSRTRIYSQYSYTYQGRRGEAPLIPSVEQLFAPCAERIERETGSSLTDILGGESSSETESESEGSTQDVEYWRPREAEGGDFPRAAAEALEPDELYQSAGPENFPPPPPTPEPENQPDDWFDQESLDLEPDLAAAMADETNQGSKAVLATPPFEFTERFQTNSSKILFALSRISSDKANDACHTWKANFNNKTAVLGDLFAPRNWGTISEFIKELDNEFLDPHLKLKAEIALHDYEQREMTVDAYFGGLKSKLVEAGLPPDADERKPTHHVLRVEGSGKEMGTAK
ncbi:hypothetical protein SERLA73DRAFT_159872 [Serpula lacrymans var. lacrymans S7.3]|uniref:Uncharacterized protein n=1 Tax=Serpula lacrymans var. lacrymans (strain S7.3) TaxID=936435 RepID=F8PUD4_SERL3|nr:hypothetical protein SERLA73DRAFT_159872 [Serpula lacrymans var. lacrymans S7.3]